MGAASASVGGATSRCLPPTGASARIGSQLLSSVPVVNLQQFSILSFNSVCPDRVHAQEIQLQMYTDQLKKKPLMFYLLAEVISSYLFRRISDLKK